MSATDPKAEASDVSKGRYGSIQIFSSGEHRDRADVKTDSPFYHLPEFGHIPRDLAKSLFLPFHCDIYTDVKDLSAKLDGQRVWIRARLASSSLKDDKCYATLRQSCRSVQLLVEVNEQVSPQFVKFVGSITRESVVDVLAIVVKAAPVEACSMNDVQLVGVEVWTVSAASPELPFSVEDAARAEANDPGAPRLDLETRLDHRVVDLRTAANHAIFRIQSGVCRLFRESLTRQGFIEVHIPKLVAGHMYNEFSMDYYGKTAYLVPTLQFTKQAVIAGDFEKVFTIGAVFRTEDRKTHRHLTEFVGLDLEMTIKNHYHECMDLIARTFIEIFKGLEEQYAADIKMLNDQYKVRPFKYREPPLCLEYPEAMKMLRDAGLAVDDDHDLSMTDEKLLGDLVFDKYGTDFFVLDKFPYTNASRIRFFTMPDPHNPKVSNSYDMFMRGAESLSGCQRIHDRDMSIRLHKTDPNFPYNGTYTFYYDYFKYGCPPHAGGGIGLERFVMNYLGLDNIRKASLFPRDPMRLKP